MIFKHDAHLAHDDSRRACASANYALKPGWPQEMPARQERC